MLGAVSAGVAFAALALVVALGTRGQALPIDEAWHALWLHPPEGIVIAARVLNSIGGGFLGVIGIPVLGAAFFFWRRGALAAALFLLASAVSALSVQVLKNLVGRPRPDGMLVEADFGSFPSGHAANAATIAVIAFLLFPRLWVALVGIAWVVLMGLSRTALSVHWLSDILAGTLLGIAAALTVAVFFESGRRRAQMLQAADRTAQSKEDQR